MHHDAGRDVERWFQDHADQVLAYLLHRTDPDTAQDLVQEVFILAHRKHAVVPEPAIGWLIACARRVLANSRRGSGRRRQLLLLLGREASTTGAADTVRPEHDLADVLAGLSPLDQEVLTLSAWYELTADQAAQALGCTAVAYRVRLHRARQRLALLLRPEPDQPRPTTPRLGGVL